MMKRRSRAKTIVAEGNSTAFDDLRWRKGTAYFTFQDGTSDTMDMSKSDFLDWVQDPSWGTYWNKYLRP